MDKSTLHAVFDGLVLIFLSKCNYSYADYDCDDGELNDNNYNSWCHIRYCLLNWFSVVFKKIESLFYRIKEQV